MKYKVNPPKSQTAPWRVNLAASAEEDLFEIYQYVYRNDSEEKAEKLYSKLYEKCLSLQQYPKRGHIPPELSLLGMNDFLELNYKPYRIIYQIIEKEIFVHCILDSRRDMQKLLQERLIRD
ncbi:MAG: type II toxin-antitoxin system RelE/ParE family toxin [Ignavibacteriales bacterium]|nr:type II toxin-antitoxin system RelE/ParE family toxin [Ignavibacteriales bacterium]